jgi:hypothetical protein
MAADGGGVDSAADRMTAGIGTSKAEDAGTAGRTAAAAAMAQLAGASPALVLAYASVAYDLPALLAGIREETGGAPLAGATTCGQFQRGQLEPPGLAVTVVVLTAGPYRFGVASGGNLRDDPGGLGRELARTARDAAGPGRRDHAAMLLLCDGLTESQQPLLSGIYRVTGAAVPVVGGAAGDDMRMRATYVFHDDQVRGDAAVAVWIDSDWPLGVVARHGWKPRSLPMMITEADGTLVHTIAGRPGTTVFRENTDIAEAGDQMVPVRQGGWYAAHALGLIEPDGSQLIRGVYVDDNHQLRTFVPLPPYSAVQTVSCQQDDLLAISDTIASEALGGRDAAVLLAFSCVARLDILRDRSAEEPARLQAAAGQVPTVGFYTYGEFARTSGVAGYHNATLAAIAL